MRRFVLLACATVSLASCSCNDKPKKESVDDKVSNGHGAMLITVDCESHLMKRKENNLNISILLDLSDRIDLPGQQAKDSFYILSIAKAFNNHVKDKKLGLLYDKMEVFFEPAPVDSKINELAEQLKVSYVKGVSKNEWVPKTHHRYESIPMQIYGLARAVSKNKGYPGSDTWGFFKNHVKDYCIDSCRRNILVILTDGYLYHESNKREDGSRTSYLTPQRLAQLNLNRPDWEEQMEKQGLGFIPATDGLESLEVLVVGIQNQNSKHPYAQEILEAYWQEWLQKMGVARYKIKNADLPSHVEKVIFDFIQNRP